MSAGVVRREQLDVLVVLAAIQLVLDAVVREVNLAIEVRQVVLACPVADLVRGAVWSSVGVCLDPVVVLQELLVLAFEILLERMNNEQFAGRRWKALLSRKIVERKGRKPSETYTLLALDEIEKRPGEK